MLGRFAPKGRIFFDFFEQHAALTVTGTKALVDLVQQGDRIEARALQIKEIEHDTDVITHRCVEALHKTFFTPIDRDSIHRLITRMDDIMDYVEAAAERIALYELTVMTAEVKELADVAHRAAVQVQLACKELRDLKSRRILEIAIEINRLENEGDAILRRAVAKLFRGETDPILVIKWKEIYENLESATDRCEDVANIIEGLVLEHG